MVPIKSWSEVSANMIQKGSFLPTRVESSFWDNKSGLQGKLSSSTCNDGHLLILANRLNGRYCRQKGIFEDQK